MSKTTTFRFPLGNGNEFEINFTTNPFEMSYRTTHSNECNHAIGVPFEIDIDRTGSDPIGSITINPNSPPPPPNAISINSSLRVKLTSTGILVDGNSKGDKVIFKA